MILEALLRAASELIGAGKVVDAAVLHPDDFSDFCGEVHAVPLTGRVTISVRKHVLSIYPDQRVKRGEPLVMRDVVRCRPW